MTGNSQWAEAYITLVISAGVVMVVGAVSATHTNEPLLSVLLLLLSITCSGWRLKIPGVGGTISTGYTIVLYSAVELSLAETVVIGVAGAVSQSLWHAIRRPTSRQIAFNVAVVALSAAASARTFRVFDAASSMAIGLIAAAAMYFVTNSVLVTCVIALTEEKRFAAVWREHCVWSLPYYVLSAPLIAVFECARRHFGSEVMLLALPAVYAIYRTFTIYVGRLEDGKKHAESMAAIRERTIEELQAAKHKAEEGSRIKSEFLANMSHEIRTPMNGVLGMTELALSLAHNPEQQEYLETARSSAVSFLALLNDILDFSRIEAGKLPIESVSFEPRSLVKECVRMLGPSAHAKGLVLRWTCDDKVALSIMADPVRVRQVLMNLVGNAVKFTPTGSIDVRLSLDEHPSTLRFCVQDTGIGIPKEKQASVFDAFTQADGSVSRKYGGAGLGLSIASTLVQLMGGRIEVESEPGVGSVFTFTVPYEVPEPRRSVPSTAVDGALTPMRILLVEDNVVNQTVAVRLLKKSNHTVIIASDGTEALRATEVDRFDLILMDVEMSPMNGFDATAAIRKRETGTFRHVPIIAMTAHAMSGYRERCLAAGMDGYVTKPLVVRHLLHEIAAVAACTASLTEA